MPEITTPESYFIVQRYVIDMWLDCDHNARYKSVFAAEMAAKEYMSKDTGRYNYRILEISCIVVGHYNKQAITG